MSRTDIDPAALAKALRGMAGDGGIEWVMEPIQASVLLDVADALDENDRLREQLDTAEHNRTRNVREYARMCHENDRLRELAERAWKAAEMLCQAFDGPCRDDGVTIYKPCPMGERDEECVYGLLQRDLRELGIEVDE